MAFENIIGQERVKRFFTKVLTSERLSHAYLFLGPSGVGKEAMAIEVAKACLGEADNPASSRVGKLTHPDVQVIFPAPKKIDEGERASIVASIVKDPYQRLQPWANPSISIDSIREIRRKSAYKSFEGSGRVVLVLDCERMTLEAANALLKILEEPPDKTYLLMTSSHHSLLLPTITSRCQLVKFDPLAANEIHDALQSRQRADERKARLCSKLADGSYRRALELLSEGTQELQEQALTCFRQTIQSSFTQVCYVDGLLNRYQRDNKRIRELLAHLLGWFRDALVFRETAGEATDSLIHSDDVEVLKKFTSAFPNADLHSAAMEIEKSLELMDRNVQVNLILIVLLNKLRMLVRRK